VKTVVEGTVIPDGKVTVMVDPLVKAPVVAEVWNAMVHGVATPATVLKGVKVRVPELSTVVADVKVSDALLETSPGAVSVDVAKVNAVPVAVPLAGLVKPPRMNVPSVVAARPHAPVTLWNSTGLSVSVIVTEFPVVTSVAKQLTNVPPALSSVGRNVVVEGTTIGDGNVTVIVDPIANALVVDPIANALVVVKSIVQADGALSVVVTGTNVTTVLWAWGWIGEPWPAPGSPGVALNRAARATAGYLIDWTFVDLPWLVTWATPWGPELALPTAPDDAVERANDERTASDKTRLILRNRRNPLKALDPRMRRTLIRLVMSDEALACGGVARDVLPR
jgi:hypothetical protein